MTPSVHILLLPLPPLCLKARSEAPLSSRDVRHHHQLRPRTGEEPAVAQHAAQAAAAEAHHLHSEPKAALQAVTSQPVGRPGTIRHPQPAAAAAVRFSGLRLPPEEGPDHPAFSAVAATGPVHEEKVFPGAIHPDSGAAAGLAGPSLPKDQEAAADEDGGTGQKDGRGDAAAAPTATAAATKSSPEARVLQVSQHVLKGKKALDTVYTI